MSYFWGHFPSSSPPTPGFLLLLPSDDTETGSELKNAYVVFLGTFSIDASVPLLAFAGQHDLHQFLDDEVCIGVDVYFGISPGGLQRVGVAEGDGAFPPAEIPAGGVC